MMKMCRRLCQILQRTSGKYS